MMNDCGYEVFGCHSIDVHLLQQLVVLGHHLRARRLLEQF